MVMKRKKLKIIWTCSDFVHHEHRYKWIAWLCGKWQKGIWLLRKEYSGKK
jgi:hypothetical protein